MSVEVTKIKISLETPSGVQYGSIKIGDAPTVFSLSGPPDDIETFLEDLMAEYLYWKDVQ